MIKILKNDFFTRDALTVAEDLMGKIICSKKDGRVIRGRILEAEAYIGVDDKACHARHGKTKRNEVMWEKGGRAYVYLCYGLFNLLNIVADRKGFPAGVLIRKIEPLSGLDPTLKTYLSGNLTKYLQVDRSYNKVELKKETGLWIEDDGYKPKEIQKDKRIGIDYAEDSKDLLWRFIAKI